MENELALKLLKSRIDSINSLPWEERQIALVTGLLAGNVFDWGAKEVVQIMENSDFGFTDASKKLEGTYFPYYLFLFIYLKCILFVDKCRFFCCCSCFNFMPLL